MNPNPSCGKLRRTLRRVLLILLTLFLTAALWGCGAAPDTGTESTTAPVSTAAPRALPEPGADRLELDGNEIGPIYLLEGVEYLDAGALTERWELAVTEPEPGALRWSLDGASVTYRDGSAEAERSNGANFSLSAPALRGDDTWYLPLSVLRDFLPRTGIYDRDERVLRFYVEEPGPALCYHDSFRVKSTLLGSTPLLTADAFCNMTGAEKEETVGEDGVPTLTLEVFGRVLRFRSGSLRYTLDEESTELPVPAYQEAYTYKEGTFWNLPVCVLEDLGCVTLEDEANEELDLWRITEGPALWLDGVGMGKTLLCGEVPCVPLPAAAAALDGILPQNSHAWLLTVGDHTLSFFPGSAEAEVDGAAAALPVPAILWKEEPLIPVEFLAEALGIPRLEGEDLIYSRMEARDTVLWVDGKEAASFVRGDSPLYLRLNDLCLPEENDPELWVNSAEFLLLGKRILLTGGSQSVQIDDEEVTLADPVLADGESWYAPTELLTVLGLTEFRDPDLDQIYYTHIVRHDDLAVGYRVPVLMYHAVSDDIWGIPELFISPSTLEKQIQAMLEGGYTAITFEDLDHIDEIEKPVMLTFDDGYDDNYKYLFPLLQKYNVKATVFVIVNDLGKNHKLTKAQVKEMSDSGLVSIQSHTMSHGYLSEMSESQLHREHYNSMVELARITGKQPFVLCYPTGKSAGYSRKITAQYYEYGLCMGGPCWVTGDAPYLIYRYYIPRKTTLDTFLRYLEG